MERGVDHEFGVAGLDGARWSSASPIRGIFRNGFQDDGLRTSIRAAFRNTLVRLGQDLFKSPEAIMAWSQNLGHERVLTTFVSYGAVACDRQRREPTKVGNSPTAVAIGCK
jgi:hypothetical protein